MGTISIAPVLAGLAGVVFTAALLDAAISDLKGFRIPNRDSVLIAAAFVVAVPALGFGVQAVAWHMAAAMAAFVLGAALFALKVWGGGDAKLVSAVTLMAGFAGLPRFLLVMALAGGMLSLVLLVLRRLPVKKSMGRACCGVGPCALRRRHRGGRIGLGGPVIAAASGSVSK